ncbi:hypothetical protein RND81_14G010000 [Saponaria officinalis]|uniref:Transmembrane protein n=1 Tax=Saponaria officinalis TaxID=3572 RepID=A0AAW1GST9_SAPOF
MAAKIAIMSSSLTTRLSPHNTKLAAASSSSNNQHSLRRMMNFRVNANLGESSSDGEQKKGDKRKFITKEQEPEQYWQTAGEREGENPMSTPLPYILIFGMSTPFIILALAFANGWIKAPIR